MAEADQDLLSRAVGGDTSARDALFSRHYLSVFRFFELNATWVAEDLTQKTFMACLERLGSVPADAFRPYLFGIARKQLLMYLRKVATRGQHDAPPVEVRKTGVSTIVARSQRQRRLLVALAKLTEEQRTMITLHYWEGLNSTELANVLGIPASTVRTRLARVRDQIKERLLEQGESDDALEAEFRAVGPRLDVR